MRSSIIVLFSKYCYNIQIKENEMGGECSTHEDHYKMLIGKFKSLEGPGSDAGIRNMVAGCGLG
jgi:hypothetical protein